MSIYVSSLSIDYDFINLNYIHKWQKKCVFMMISTHWIQMSKKKRC